MTKQGHSTAQAAMAIGAYGAGHVLASALGGYLADRIGRRRTIVLSMFSAAVAMMLLSQAATFLEFIVLSAVAGLTAELYRPASSALLADLVPPSQRVTAYAAYRICLNAGWAFGPATAGFLAKFSFFWLFVGDAITSVLFGLVAWFALPPGVQAIAKQCAWSEAWRVIRRDRQLHQVLIASAAIALVFFQISSTYGLQVKARGLSESSYGALLSLNGVIVVLFEMAITRRTRRYSARRVMALGYALIGIGFAANAFAATFATLALAMMVFTLGEMISIPVTSAYIAELAPAHLRGRYMGAYSFVWAMALTCGPSGGMWLFGVAPQALWIACGLLGLFAGAVVLRSAPSATPLDSIEDGLFQASETGAASAVNRRMSGK
jgi:MFS family permease